MTATDLTTAEEAELAALAVWFPTAPLTFGPYQVRPGVTVADPIRSHAYIRHELAREVGGRQRRALLSRLRVLWHLFGDLPPLAVDPADRRRVEVFP
jgi:hypothetical protein